MQVVGAEEDGPKTLKVMGLASLSAEPLSAAVMELAGMTAPTKPEDGAMTLKVGDAGPTTVSDIPDPQADAA
jgi:hypothetical protein